MNTYLESLETQGDIWNDAWGKMLRADYKPKHWLRDLAKTYQANYDLAASVLSYRPNAPFGEEAPSFIYLDVALATAKDGDFVGRGRTRKFGRTAALDGAWFAHNDARVIPFKMQVEALGNDKLEVEIVGPAQEHGAANLRDLVPAGNYLGLVWSKQERGRPLALVSLVAH